MIKRIFTTAMVLIGLAVFTNASAQEVFPRGQKTLSLGVGVGSYLGPFGSTLGGDGYKFTIPPVSLTYEQCVVDKLIRDNGSIGVGGYVGVATNKWTTKWGGGGEYGWRYTYINLGVRGAFHYQFVKSLDTYAGTMLGYSIVSHKAIGEWGSDWSYTAASNSFAYSAFIGARYYVSDNFGLYAELGYGISALELGLTIKL